MSSVINETADHENDLAIYTILSRISQKWGYPSDDLSGKEEELPVKRPDETAKASVSDSSSEWDAFEKTVIFGSPEQVAHPEPIAHTEPEPKPEPKSKPEPESELEPEKSLSEWDALEKTVIISNPPAKAPSLKEASPLSSSANKYESRDTSTAPPGPAWDEPDETIRITPQNAVGDSDLDETLILGNRSGKRPTIPAIPKATDSPPAIPRVQDPPDEDNDDDDIILETVILGPGSYE